MIKCPACGHEIHPDMGLTKIQHNVLKFLCEYEEEYGYVPNYQTVTDHFKWTSKTNFYRILGQLERRGYVQKSYGVVRSLKILHRV